MQLADIAAQDGTTGVGDGDGDGEGLGDALALGLADAEADAEGDGEGECVEATGAVLLHPARRAAEAAASAPALRLTGHTNESGGNGVTGRTADTGRTRIRPTATSLSPPEEKPRGRVS